MHIDVFGRPVRRYCYSPQWEDKTLALQVNQLITKPNFFHLIYYLPQIKRANFFLSSDWNWMGAFIFY